MNKPMNVILEKVFVSDKDKENKPFLDRNGKPYKKVAIKTNIHGEMWLSTLSFRDNDPVRELKEGQSVSIVVEEKGQYKNFSLPSRADLLESRIEALEKAVFKGQHQDDLGDLETDISAEDLPF